MSYSFGQNLKITVFGQSHSDSIGVVIDGIPAGIKIDMEHIMSFMKRRAPGRNSFSTPRKEKDIPEIISGLVENVTCGAPICAVIKNNNIISKDYSKLKDIPRPSHSDYTAFMKYSGFNDIRGGGQFSGRLTSVLCFAGAICLQLLKEKNIYIGAHISQIGSIKDQPFDSLGEDISLLERLSIKDFPTIDEDIGEKMKEEIETAKEEKDSLGGIIECIIQGVPVGIGEPMFDSVESRLSSAIFSVPAVRGIEFGAGFSSVLMKGSEHNDSYHYDDSGNIITSTNNHGGVIGGITSGMPIIFRTSFKPTASIGKKQKSINLKTKTNVDLEVVGRHDPCIVPRAVPVIEAVSAIVLLDLLFLGGLKWI